MPRAHSVSPLNCGPATPQQDGTGRAGKYAAWPFQLIRMPAQQNREYGILKENSIPCPAMALGPAIRIQRLSRAGAPPTVAKTQHLPPQYLIPILKSCLRDSVRTKHDGIAMLYALPE